VLSAIAVLTGPGSTHRIPTPEVGSRATARSRLVTEPA
jgi:hypothetical protein